MSVRKLGKYFTKGKKNSSICPHAILSGTPAAVGTLFLESLGQGGDKWPTGSFRMEDLLGLWGGFNMFQWNKYFSPAARALTANIMLVRSIFITVFHCDLHSFQENSQPERQPPTYSLTLASHLHCIIPPLALIFAAMESYHLRNPSEVLREYLKVIKLQHTVQWLQENIL